MESERRPASLPSHPHRRGTALAGLHVDDIVGIRFIASGPVAYCSPGEFALGVGDYVVVRMDRGERLGWVVIAAEQVLAGTSPTGPVRVVDRIASAEDIASWEHSKAQALEDQGRAQEFATRTDPRMRVASLTYDLAGERGELTFTAPERVEHRWLQQQLSDLLQVRLEVTQVGDRDRAKAAGGIDVCGRALCCSTWMTEFPAISIKMAKDQDLPPNPSKISGVCGRLLCCLSFEVDAYRELRGDLPKLGKRVTTPVGRAKVISINSLKQVVRLRMDDTNEIIELPAEELRKQYGTAVRPEELEQQIEGPHHRRDKEQRENMLAILEPRDAPTSPTAFAASVAAYRGEAVGVDVGVAVESGADAEALDGALDADGEPRKRRRRGRRGGRGRGGAATTEGGVAGGADGDTGDVGGASGEGEGGIR